MPSHGVKGVAPSSVASSSLFIKDSDRISAHARLSADDLQLEDLGSVKEILKDLAMKMDILMDAISLAHMKGPDGKCKEDCWSCKVMENIEGIKVARKLRGPE
jgi:hypothetical protein